MFDNLTEDILIQRISEAMGPIDREKVVFDVMEIISKDAGDQKHDDKSD